MKVISLCSIFVVVAVATASPVLNSTLDNYSDCTINRYHEAAEITESCTTISVGSFAVPAGKTLKLALKPGAKLTFDGEISFAYEEWEGPLIWITGSGITVRGSLDHLLNGRGAHWWDGKGDHSTKKKPRLMFIQATGGSVFSNIRVRNCPHTCIGISDSHDLTLHDWSIDSRDGDTEGGHNTDGFDIAKSYRVTIKDTNVWNQDDCICVNQGQHLHFDNIHCTGGHGLSIAVGLWDTHALNTVYNVTFQNSVVKNSRNGIHVKTIAGKQTGEISQVIYKNIELSGISHYGINVQQDYTNDGDTHQPLGNIKIKHLTMEGITGTLHGPHSENVYILCGDGGCGDWHWSRIDLSGSSNKNKCNFDPFGFNC